MRRRDFIAAISSAAVWPAAARAQLQSVPVIGHLELGSARETAHLNAAFSAGLSEVGYVEGRDVFIETRWADGRYESLPSLAADLVHRKVAVIATTGGTPSALAAKAASATTPIIFLIGVDPVAMGFVASLNRPGGNMTGVNSLANELAPKRLEVLHQVLAPGASIALLFNANNASLRPISAAVEQAARNVGRALQIFHASSDIDLDAVFATLVQQRIGGLVIAPDGFLNSRIKHLAALTLRHSMPAVFQDREFALGGGLMSYGTNLKDLYRLVGTYAGRVLKGEKPSELPVQQATRLELILNLKTAKALGLTVPLFLEQRADEIIE